MKHVVILLAYSVWEYWLGKTTKVIANSSWELIVYLLKKGFSKLKVQ